MDGVGNAKPFVILNSTLVIFLWCNAIDFEATFALVIGRILQTSYKHFIHPLRPTPFFVCCSRIRHGRHSQSL